jgi:8-oxo-dGTP diphosphatase
LDGSALPGRGFLAEVCREWEAAAGEASGVRRVVLRIGIALAREGGALPRLLLPFRLGLGGRLGDGRQWLPWVHADDVAPRARRRLPLLLPRPPLRARGRARRRAGAPVRLPYARLADVDWERWSPRQRATLLFVVRGGEILLIEKKRGLGAGKVNGPGGRLEPGETPRACALREVREELGVTPLGVSDCGALRFQFLDGLSIHGSVFRAEDCEGEPRETDEAVPLWTPIDAIPYERMWADDRLWLPHLLAGRRFQGRFLFDGDEMLDGEVASAGGDGAGPS